MKNGVCLSFSDEELEEETGKWSNSLVFYVIGADHTLVYLDNFIAKAWAAVDKPVLHQYDECFFIARFKSAEECDKVLVGGPHTVKNQLWY